MIEQWGDISKMSVTESVGCLLAFEGSESDRPDDHGGKEDQLLFMTRALELLMQKKGGNGNGKQKKHRKFDIKKFNVLTMMKMVILPLTARNQSKRKHILQKKKMMIQHYS